MVAQKRVALSARVSTMDKGQDPETQLLALREYAARRGFVPAGEYVDYASGTRDNRPQYQALLTIARKRQVDVVLVWRYDRFARSTQALVQALPETFRADAQAAATAVVLDPAGWGGSAVPRPPHLDDLQRGPLP